MQTNLSTTNKPKTKIITEYKPEYCDLYIQYATTYVNPNGFWGQYNIDESVKETWISTYPEFGQVVNLIPNITAHIINKSLKELLDKAALFGDVKLITQILLKVLDIQFRNDKETGEIKDRARANKTARDKGDLSISDYDEEIVKEALARKDLLGK
jgi:hypothetical protein